MAGKTPEQQALRALSASSRRLFATIDRQDRKPGGLNQERRRIVGDMAALLDEMGLHTNAQLLLLARDRIGHTSPSEANGEPDPEPTAVSMED